MDEQFAETEDIAERGLRYTREQFEQIMEQTEEYVRSNPTRALAYAAVAGLVIDRLPVCRILMGLARLSLIAVKPAVLIYGATKLYQAAQENDG
ncbi:MAG TPA: hypothetical protein VK474_10355 [Chthoniobacterales bacterium]|nr:hypothetical protein [Chthoniobacterales bacterium]